MTTPLPTNRAPPPFDTDTLEADGSSICALDRGLCITFVNRAWREFSRANGGDWGEGQWRLGAPILDAFPPPVRPFYERLFARAQRSRGPIEHSYDCPTPDLFRAYRSRVFPCHEGALLVVHALALEMPHPRAALAESESIYRGASGMITQCSHCRRVRRAGGDTARWDWVPAYVAQIPPRTSHGLCDFCEEYYYRLPARGDPPAAMSVSADPLAPASILVADDDTSVRLLIGRILRQAGFRVTEIGSEETARRMVEDGQFDLVLLDPERPALRSLATVIRAVRPRLPILLLSAGASAAGDRYFVQKPFTPTALLEAVHLALARRA